MLHQMVKLPKLLFTRLTAKNRFVSGVSVAAGPLGLFFLMLQLVADEIRQLSETFAANFANETRFRYRFRLHGLPRVFRLLYLGLFGVSFYGNHVVARSRFGVGIVRFPFPGSADGGAVVVVERGAGVAVARGPRAPRAALAGARATRGRARAVLHMLEHHILRAEQFVANRADYVFVYLSHGPILFDQGLLVSGVIVGASIAGEARFFLWARDLGRAGIGRAFRQRVLPWTASTTLRRCTLRTVHVWGCGANI